MRSPRDRQHGIVAVLDALGAASYGDEEIKEFMRSRQNVLRLLGQKIEGVLGHIESRHVEVFTFNDTVLIAFKTNTRPPGLEQVAAFFRILRRFLVDSLSHGILFRGSVAIGTFYVDAKSNTVMGQAVTDAAAWYEKANWIGLHATPRATITIQRWLEQNHATKGYLMLDYDVPLRDGSTLRVKAVNWPKVFFLSASGVCERGVEPKERLLEFLSDHTVPLGAEGKYFNTIAFFDYAARVMKKKQAKKHTRTAMNVVRR
jgi:hypothetical protein